MRHLHIVLPGQRALNLAPAHLFMLGAAIIAICLLWSYVRLLNESVVHGAQWRAEQQTAADARGAKPARSAGKFAAPRTPVAVAADSAR